MKHQVVGKSVQRKDGIQKVTGSAVFGADVNLSGQLYGAVCRSPHPHAKIKAVHKQEALKLPGVHVVLTGADYNKLFGQYIEDQPIIAYDKVRYQGEPVALVAADDLLTAQEAVRLIEVEYELLPVINSVEEALKNETLLHEDWSKYNIISACNPVQNTNIGDTFTLRKGDVTQGFAESDLVVESEFSCGMLQHTTIETHSTVAHVNKATGEITVYSPVQSPFTIRTILARTFGVPLEKVRVICTEIGGAFGSKYEAKAEPLAIALAMFTKGRPVKLQFSRDEEFLASVARGPVQFKMKTGVKNDGTLLAQDVTIYWDTGAYVTTGPRINYNAGFAACGPYKIPNAEVNAFCVTTNKSLASAYRGFGVPEVACAHEYQMDLIAKKLDLDPLELRLKNILTDGDLSVTGESMRNIAVKECLEAAAENIDWSNKPLRWTSPSGKLCGKGIACFCKLTGTPSTTSVILKLNENGSLTILDASREMGQGVVTVLPQIAAEALGMNIDKISVSPVDTAFSPYDKTTTSSRSTFHGGNAILMAAQHIKEQLLVLAAKHFGVPLTQMEYVDGIIRCKNDLTKSIHINDVGESGILKEQPPVIGVGTYGTLDLFDKPNPLTHQSQRPTVMWMFGAQSAVVEVDPRNGRIQVKTVGAAHDVGYAINPVGCMQQIEGSVIMGLGHALMEEMIYEDGQLRNGNMLDYKVPTFMDSDVDFNISLIEKNHEEGPFGAKGLGEPGVAATAAAILNAVNAACNANFNAIPIKPEHVIFRKEI